MLTLNDTNNFDLCLDSFCSSAYGYHRDTEPIDLGLDLGMDLCIDLGLELDINFCIDLEIYLGIDLGIHLRID
jgi:hypothetical protein